MKLLIGIEERWNVTFELYFLLILLLLINV